MAPLVSHLTKLNIVEPRAIDQKTVFDAATLFMRTEGILPAPESSHAIAVAIQEALRAKAEGREPVILFNLSGHGFLDISAYNGHGNGRTG
jgi:tryptophan synthase beta chain